MSDVDGYQHHWFMVGKCSALEDLAGSLRNEAGAYFADGKEKEAHLVRDLANRIKGYGEAARAEADTGRDVVYPGIKALDLLIDAWKRGLIKGSLGVDVSILKEIKAFVEAQDK